MEVVVMSTTSLCFKEAQDARKSGEIGLEEFLKNVVAHYGGLRHQADTEGQRAYILKGFEYEVREVVLSEDFRPLDEDGESQPTVYS